MTHPAMSTEPGPGNTCRICGTVLAEGSLRCSHCGKTYGEHNRCPHCGSIADVEPNRALRYRCLVCGGPRVPVTDTSIEPSGRERAPLATAQHARLRIGAWRVAAAVVAAFGALSLFVTLLTLAFISPGVLATTGLLAAVSVPFVLAALAWLRARRYVRDRDAAIEQAWISVASDVLREKGGELDAREIASLLRLDEAQAEQLLARLDVESIVRTRVTDAGELLYSSSADRKLRVEEHADATSGTSAQVDEEPEEEAVHPRQARRSGPESS